MLLNWRLILSAIFNSFVVVFQFRIVMNLYSGVAMILLSRLFNTKVSLCLMWISQFQTQRNAFLGPSA